jgi:hypothetical protein
LFVAHQLGVIYNETIFVYILHYEDDDHHNISVEHSLLAPISPSFPSTQFSKYRIPYLRTAQLNEILSQIPKIVYKTGIQTQGASWGSNPYTIHGRAIAHAVSRWLPNAAVRGSRPGLIMRDFVVDKVALGQVFSEYFGFPCQFPFHQLLHNHPHLSFGVCTIGQMWPQYLGT